MSNPAAHYEALVFLDLVKRGVCSVAEARRDIDVTARQIRWFRGRFPADVPWAREAWAFRKAVLTRFNQLVQRYGQAVA